MGLGSPSLGQLARRISGLAQVPSPGPSPCPRGPCSVTCSFQRKSSRAVDSTCWACRYSASANTSRITGVMYLSATRPAAGLRVGRGKLGVWKRHRAALPCPAPEPSLTSPAHRKSHWKQPWQGDTRNKVIGSSWVAGWGQREGEAETAFPEHRAQNQAQGQGLCLHELVKSRG